MSFTNLAVSDATRVCEFIRKQRSVKLWIEKLLDIKGKLEDDLHISLKSGVILCYLMLEIDQNSIPRLQEETEQEFKLKENILFFLEAIRDYGVPKHKLFQLADFIVNVVETLAALAQLSSQKGFRSSLEEVPAQGNYTDESILAQLQPHELKRLKEQLSKLKEPVTPTKRPKVSDMIVRRKLALLAGSGVNISHYETAFSKFQALFRGHLVRKQFQKRVRDQAYRDNVAKEIYTTEQIYVKNLETCLQVYYKPLKEMKKQILDAEQLKAIFSNIETIHDVNAELLKELEPIVTNWSPQQCLGTIFLKIMDFLKIYSGYIQNFNNALDTLHQCKKKSSFEKFLMECKDNEANLQELSSYLIMPVQRIPRYNLLLKELARHTWTDHRDYENLSKAVSKADEIAGYLNEMKREAENMAALMDIQSRITGKAVPRIAETHRKLVKQGTLQEQKQGALLLCLFNDMLLIAKQDAKKKILRTFHVADDAVTKYKDSYLLADIEAIGLQDANFEIKHIKQKKSLYIFAAKSTEEKDIWLKLIQPTKESKDSQEAPPTFQEVGDTPNVKDAERKLRERRKTIEGRPPSVSESPSKSSSLSPETSSEGAKKLEEARKRITDLQERRNVVSSIEVQENLVKSAEESPSFKKETEEDARCGRILQDETENYPVETSEEILSNGEEESRQSLDKKKSNTPTLSLRKSDVSDESGSESPDVHKKVKRPISKKKDVVIGCGKCYWNGMLSDLLLHTKKCPGVAVFY